MGDEKDKEIEEVKENKEDQKAPEKETKKKPKSKSEKIRDEEIEKMLNEIKTLQSEFESKKTLSELLKTVEDKKMLKLLVASLAYLKYCGSFLNKIVNKGGLANVSKALFGKNDTLTTFSKQYKGSNGKFGDFNMPAIANSCPVGTLVELDSNEFDKIKKDDYEKLSNFVNKYYLTVNKTYDGLVSYKQDDDKRSYRTKVINAWVNIFKDILLKIKSIENDLTRLVQVKREYNESSKDLNKRIFGDNTDKSE